MHILHSFRPPSPKLGADSAFLRDAGVMDYSLLVGVTADAGGDDAEGDGWWVVRRNKFMRFKGEREKAEKVVLRWLIDTCSCLEVQSSLEVQR